MVIVAPRPGFSLEDTGRLVGTLPPRARAIVFGAVADQQIDTDLWSITEVDRAHLVMLCETGLLPADRLAPILRRIDDLRASGFAALRGMVASRGLYLLYEAHLIETLGEDVGGILQTARSRNDLSATVQRMKLRAVVADTLASLCRLQSDLLRQARRSLDVVFPIYTHYQPAQPVTLAHYYAGAAGALRRDAEALTLVLAELDRCPLGAGAIGGTSLPIDSQRTAALLGFTEPWSNSIDAIASRDGVLRLLAALSVLGVTISRIAHDLQQWTTQEFGFLSVADELVGGSSMMPQKRNVYLLEHVKGKAAAPLGGFTAAAGAMHAAPFTNSIAVGTEGVRPVWEALGQMRDALVLLRIIVSGAEPNREAMQSRARAGYTNATALAEWLVREQGMAFRTAHHLVGQLIRQALENGESDLLTVVQATHPEWFRRSPPPQLEVKDVAFAAAFGGGPTPDKVASDLVSLRRDLSARIAALRLRRARWRHARQALDATVAQITG